jgi:hypothetical protein
MQPSKWELLLLWVAAQICKRFGHMYQQDVEVFTQDTGYEGFICTRCDLEWGHTYY